MGRYNNKRTQAAAQAAKNTPSRARFSKAPPSKGGRGGRGGKRKEREPPPKPKSRGIGGAGVGKTSGGRGGRSRGNPQTTARVIDKIQNRVGGNNNSEAPSVVAQQQPSSAASSSIDIALKNLDKSKLDVVAVSKETQNLIADLLRELGVVGGGNNKAVTTNDKTDDIENNDVPPTTAVSEASTTSTLDDDQDEGYDNDDGDASSVDSDQRMYDFLVEQSDARNTDAAILEEDYGDGDEDDELQKRMAASRRKKHREEEGKKQQNSRPEQEQGTAVSVASQDENDNGDPMEEGTPLVSESEADEEENNKTDNIDAFENDRTFLHLTQTLSFSRSQATKACQAIECWDTNIKPKDDEKKNSSSSDTKDPRDSKIIDNNSEDDDKLELAMDWLCLHLSEAEINRGFRPNPSASKASSVTGAGGVLRGKPAAATKIKAVAHPSISVISKPIEEQAKEWAKAIQLQERTLKLMRLGFHRADAIQAFDNLPDEGCTSAVIDDPALLSLLSRLQDGDVNSSEAITSEDEATLLEDAKEEREQELEALQAIYDDRLEVVCSEGDDAIPERYILQIDPATPLGEPARAEECFLHVFLRDKYPVAQTPLLLLVTKPALPPSLCRKILSKMGETAKEILGAVSDGEIGCPVVFEVVSYLEENLPSLHKEFCNEQRRKEFEAEQARLLRQRQIEMEKSEKAMELLYDKAEAGSGGGVESAGFGRRQKAKLKAAEKAFDRPEQAKALYKEYRRKQDERVKAAQHQNTSANVRATKAQQVILNRQKELIDDEAEKAARKALNEAFRKGKSKEEARAAAEKARIESYRENGVTIVNEDNKEEETKELTEKEKGEVQKEDPAKDNSKSQTNVPRPTEASSKFMERLRNTGGQATTATNDSSSNNTTGAKKKQTKGPTPNTSAFMDRLREMYENAATNGKNSKGGKEQSGDGRKDSRASASNKLEGYHLDNPDDEDEDDESSSEENHAVESAGRKRPRPVAVPAGELVEVMTDIITQQEDQPWLVSAEARAPTTTAERKEVSQAQLKREQKISERLKSELSRKRKLAKEWAESYNGDGDGNNANKNSKKNSGKGRKKPDNSFTPERFHTMMEVRKR
jgi:hypothetical protein